MEGLDCPLTCERMKNPVITTCGHTFDREGLTQWVKKNGSCPTCRHEIPKDSKFIPNLAVRELLAVPPKEDFAMESRCLKATFADDKSADAPEAVGIFIGESGAKDEGKVTIEAVAQPPLKVSPVEDESASEYEEIEEEVSVPNSPVASPSPQPTVNSGWSFEPPKRPKQLGINPFTGEFEEYDEDSPPVAFAASSAVLQPLKEKRIVKKLVKKIKPPKPKPEVKEVPPPPPPVEVEPKLEEPPKVQHSILTIEVTIHNLNLTTALPSSQVTIAETPLTWKGVAEISAIDAQQSQSVTVTLKLKAGVQLTASSDWGSYTVEYRHTTKDFEFDISVFAQALSLATPRTQTLEHFNILLFGVAGSGKSSFVNKVATLLEGNKIPTSAFAPSGGGERHVTKKLVAYRMPKSHITLWDTWGFNGNYKDDTLAYIFEGRLPSNWQMGEMKAPVLDPQTGKMTGTRAQQLDAGASTAYQRRIHAAILVISIEDLEDPYQCAAIAEKFHLFKEFSPLLIVNKVDKPFTSINDSPSYFTWLKPWMPPVVTNAVVTAAKVSATAATAAAVWVGHTASQAHAGYREKGWEGIVEKTFTSAPETKKNNAPASIEDSRPRLAPDQQAAFDVVSDKEASQCLPFWADSQHPITQQIKRVVSERCYVNPNSVFLNVNYVEQSARNSLMDLQTLAIMEEVMRRARLFEARYGGPAAVLPHEVKTQGAGAQQEWQWAR